MGYVVRHLGQGIDVVGIQRVRCTCEMGSELDVVVRSSLCARRRGSLIVECAPCLPAHRRVHDEVAEIAEIAENR